MALGIATKVPVNFISVGLDGDDGCYGFADQINYLTEQSTLPSVLTTSYTFDESMLSPSLAK